MSIQLQEIKNIFIKNRLTEGVDFVRKEWLIGNGTAYINTMIPPTSNDVLRAVGIIVSKPTYANIGFISSSDRVYFRFIGSGGSYYKDTGTQFIIENLKIDQPESYIAPRLDEIYYAMNNTDFDFSVTFKVNKVPTYTISSTKGLFTLDTLRPDLMATNFPTSTYLIGKSYSSCVGLDTCKLSDVYINSHHFVPCQLLKSIPAILDTNNIARAAGECGMYDSISGKFYGNVADSGTFTVEGDVEPETHTGLQQIYQNKLIEGVDYETYDWLKADIPINKRMMTLPINSKNFEFKRNWIQIMNSFYFVTLTSTDTYYYYIQDLDSNRLKLAVWSGYLQSIVDISSNKIGLGIHTIIANVNGVTISSTTGTASLPWYGTPSYISFNNSYNNQNHTIHLTSSIKVDGVTRYVPCQLLHSIPRNLDAQCKERVVGECGMIDLISGKFYGNVASSGTFTVENDNNE